MAGPGSLHESRQEIPVLAGTNDRPLSLGPISKQVRKGIAMLKWALVFLVVAIIAGIFGFGGIAGASAGIAQALFFIFLILFVIGLVMNMLRKT